MVEAGEYTAEGKIKPRTKWFPWRLCYVWRSRLRGIATAQLSFAKRDGEDTLETGHLYGAEAWHGMDSSPLDLPLMCWPLLFLWIRHSVVYPYFGRNHCYGGVLEATATSASCLELGKLTGGTSRGDCHDSFYLYSELLAQSIKGQPYLSAASQGLHGFRKVNPFPRVFAQAAAAPVSRLRFHAGAILDS